MHMDSYANLIPLVVLVPAIGALINLVLGHKLGERISGLVGVTASVLAFIFSVMIFAYLSDPAVVTGMVIDPVALFDGWVRVGSEAGFHVDIPWQFRVDTISAVMLLVVTGVGSLIHIYSIGYMHGDPKYGRFFAFLNMFMMFMLILVTGNNFLMMFVGWEGVGLMSYLLIGFWWDKSGPVGWKNSDAGRKAMIANRVGDFGIIMASILIFWTFGTLNYYSPGEVANTCYVLEHAHVISEEQAEHGECDMEAVNAFAAGEADHGEATEEGEHSEEGDANAGIVLVQDTEGGGEADHAEEGTADTEHSEAEADHAEDADAHAAEGEHGEAHMSVEEMTNANFLPGQMGVFNQLSTLANLDEGEEVVWNLDANGNAIMRGREVDFGPFSTDISVMLFLIIFFLLLGATGKSAQIPLFVWLPDAMAGPTPVSALMHAATMVTAGVYLLVRSNGFLAFSPEGRFLIAIIGASTALMAGIIAMGQWDIKRVLAFSTVSQLGFMVAAVGVGAYVAAIFHLATHAVFKALLFLGSGSVIHGVEHGHHHVHEHSGHDEHHDDHEHPFDPQDMRNMGGLRSRMPITFITYLIGTFALSGLPIFAGFWSKDEILLDALVHGSESTHPLDQLAGFLVFFILLIAAAFTAFYMWRQIQMVFFGDPRSDAAAHAPESVATMTVPLVILAIGATFIGLINVPGGAWPFTLFYKEHEFSHFLEASIPSVTTGHVLSFNWLVAGIATLFAFLAIFVAHSIYAGNKAVRGEHGAEDGRDPLQDQPSTSQLFAAAERRLYWDDFYFTTVVRPYQRVAAFLANVIDWSFWHDYVHDKVIKRGYDAISGLLANPLDIGLIDGAVNGIGRLVNYFSGRFRTVQTGYVRTYAVVLLLGVVAVIVLMVLPLIPTGS
ncbi:MAG: hypothetical protein CL607_25340 [Anaerolineaceae bacterium]|nr:hypothetical protein [Anaerolineaceae bacterium]